MMKIFFEEAFKCHKGKFFTNCSDILNSIEQPCLTNEQKDFCAIELGEKELLNALISMPNNKTPGNDGLSKEFYEAFWKELKGPLLKSFCHAKNYKEFSTSHRQAIIKLFERKDRDKRLIKNWRPVSLLKKFGFGNNFIDWIKILLTNQESCVINGGSTTSYFKLEKGARQRDPISAYLFIIALEIIFLMIRSNPSIKGLNIFNHINILCTQITQHFLNDQKSTRELMKTFKSF